MVRLDRLRCSLCCKPTGGQGDSLVPPYNTSRGVSRSVSFSFPCSLSLSLSLSHSLKHSLKCSPSHSLSHSLSLTHAVETLALYVDLHASPVANVIHPALIRDEHELIGYPGLTRRFRSTMPSRKGLTAVRRCRLIR